MKIRMDKSGNAILIGTRKEFNEVAGGIFLLTAPFSPTTVNPPPKERESDKVSEKD